MPDREEVISDIQDIFKYVPLWKVEKTLTDALVLLRKQEPVKPNISCDGLPDEGGTWWYVCGNCSNAIDPDDAYCRHCGRAVNWDG